MAGVVPDFIGTTLGERALSNPACVPQEEPFMGHSISFHSSTLHTLARAIGSTLSRLGGLMNHRITRHPPLRQASRPVWAHAVSAVPAPAPRTAPASGISRAAPTPVLRVRALAPSPLPSAGRRRACLVLSGRVQDVCSELDRLAALEARQLQLI